MLTKIKNTNHTIEAVQQLSQQLGFILMMAAVTLGMIELPEHSINKMAVLNQPAFAFASNEKGNNESNPLRREREEAGPHYISYSVAQRTPARHGKL